MKYPAGQTLQKISTTYPEHVSTNANSGFTGDDRHADYRETLKKTCAPLPPLARLTRLTPLETFTTRNLLERR